MRVYENGVYRDATSEEEMELTAIQEDVIENEPNMG